MDTSALLFLLILLTAFGLLQIRDRRRIEAGGRDRPQGWWSVLRSPKLMVAPVAATVLTAALHMSGALRLEGLHLAAYIHGADWVSHGHVFPYAVLLVLGSVLLAGFVGQLSAWRAGRSPDARAFSQGIRQHSVAILLARGLVELWLIPTFTMVGPHAGFWAILYQAPSLLLAPIFAASAQHPGRPLEALRSTFAMARNRMAQVFPIFLVQAMALSLIWVAVNRTVRGEVLLMGNVTENLPWLALYGSALSFNEVPLLSATSGGHVLSYTGEATTRLLAVGLGCLAGAIVSAVCIARYHALSPLPQAETELSASARSARVPPR